MADATDVKDFGMVRLKLLLAIARSPELDQPGWNGNFSASIGGNGAVKTAAHPAQREVRLDNEPA
jgi:hypothetical protein